MRIASNPKEIPSNTTASVGTFDGIHLGHQAILEKLNQRARELESESLLITFNPPPPLFFGTASALLSTPEEKVALLEETGLQNLLILAFSEAIVQMEPEDFIEGVVVDGLKVNEIVIGETHKFGRRKRGDFRLLRELGNRWGFGVDVLAPITYKGAAISSSRVRRAVEKGQVDDVGWMLGREYSFTGRVIKGVGRGKRLAYPTANLNVENLKLLPLNGVYAVRVELADGSFPAVMNIGTRPTFVDTQRNVEVHLLDFDEALYGEFLKVYCVKRLRDEKAFQSEKALKSQIERDLRMAKELL